MSDNLLLLPERTSVSARVGANVRAEMARWGVRQSELAKLLHKPQSSISNRLKGKTPFDVEELVVVARELRTTISALLGEGPGQDGPHGPVASGLDPAGSSARSSTDRAFDYGSKVSWYEPDTPAQIIPFRPRAVAV